MPLSLEHISLEERISQKLVGASGCYVLRSNQFFEGIHRLINTDSKSILYIGKADDLFTRISSLQKSILSNSDHNQLKPKERGHKALSRKYFRIKKSIDSKQLFINYFPMPNLDPNVLESILLECYVAEYGELPPLNGQYGNYRLQEALKLNLPFKKETNLILDFLGLKKRPSK